jgi:hypothetical protein
MWNSFPCAFLHFQRCYFCRGSFKIEKLEMTMDHLWWDPNGAKWIGKLRFLASHGFIWSCWHKECRFDHIKILDLHIRLEKQSWTLPAIKRWVFSLLGVTISMSDELWLVLILSVHYDMVGMHGSARFFGVWQKWQVSRKNWWLGINLKILSYLDQSMLTILS